MASDRGRFIGTYTGRRFHPFDPSPAEVHIEDVAHGLAHTCRYAGQCRRYYSVALHSVHVSAELADRRPAVRLYGLLHDAAEAYLADVPRPVKAEFPGFEEVEAAVLEAVWAAVGVDPPDDDQWAAVRAADDRLLAYEAHELLADSDWADERPALDYDLDATIEEARGRFLSRAEALLDAV